VQFVCYPTIRHQTPHFRNPVSHSMLCLNKSFSSNHKTVYQRFTLLYFTAIQRALPLLPTSHSSTHKSVYQRFSLLYSNTKSLASPAHFPFFYPQNRVPAVYFTLQQYKEPCLSCPLPILLPTKPCTSGLLYFTAIQRALPLLPTSHSSNHKTVYQRFTLLYSNTKSLASPAHFPFF